MLMVNAINQLTFCSPIPNVHLGVKFVIMIIQKRFSYVHNAVKLYLNFTIEVKLQIQLLTHALAFKDFMKVKKRLMKNKEEKNVCHACQNVKTLCKKFPQKTNVFANRDIILTIIIIHVNPAKRDVKIATKIMKAKELFARNVQNLYNLNYYQTVVMNQMMMVNQKLN